MFFSPYAFYVIPIVVVVTLVLIAGSVRILREYERAAVFTLGHFSKNVHSILAAPRRCSTSVALQARAVADEGEIPAFAAGFARIALHPRLAAFLGD